LGYFKKSSILFLQEKKNLVYNIKLFRFSFVLGERKFELKAYSEEEKNQWVECLKCLQQYNQKKESTPSLPRQRRSEGQSLRREKAN
jgi:hypothetical protein